MQGIAAITAQNGWAMAATGACIVIVGLSVLSFIISQLHRILGIFEKKEAAVTDVATEPTAGTAAMDTVGIDPLADLAATARLYQSVTAPLGESFGLAPLYQALEAAKDPHPHITVRELKSTGYLAAAGDGNFSWKNV